MTNLVLHAGGAHLNFTPYALARMSDAFFQSAEAYTDPKLPLFNHFMRCASIELGFKSAILSQDNSQAMKDYLAKRNGNKNGVGHDLVKAHAQFVARFPEILTAAEVDALKLINPYFKNKGLEYVTSDVIAELMRGLSGFPDVDTIRSASAKLNDFLSGKEFFAEA